MNITARVEEIKITISCDTNESSIDVSAIKADHALRESMASSGFTPIENSFEFAHISGTLCASMKGICSTPGHFGK